MLGTGTRLGSFEIGPLLGMGGMGEVYRARDTRLQRDVAVKVLPASVAGDPERRARFEREARLLATLNHPNIAAIYGVEEADGVWALVLELVDGETLAQRAAGGRLPPREAARIAAQLVDALDTAHECGIVHRDLKPANVKISADGTLKVLDFGLAKAIERPRGSDATRTGDATREGTVLGTGAYMSPEQARGLAVDKRTDIWAFGCVLFELLAGRRAFDGPSASDVLVSVLEREPPWAELPSDTPSGLRRLIERCLEKDTKARLRDIADARAYLETDPALTGSGAVSTRGLPPSRAAYLGHLAYAIAAALTTLALVSAWSRWKSTPDPRFDRIMRVVGTSAHEFGPAISPDGKWIAYLSNARGPTDIWVKFIAGGEPANLTASLDLSIQTLDYVGGLQISPDGNLIAFAAGRPGLSARTFASWVIPAPLGGTARQVTEEGDQGLTWSPDGKRIAYLTAGGAAGDTVWVADADGQHPHQIVAPLGGRHTHGLRWSHDGRFVYFSYGPQSFNTEPVEIFRAPAAGGSAEPVVRSSRRAVFPFPDFEGRGLFYAGNADTVDLGVWWRDLSSGRDYRLSNGLGEYSSPSVSADGTRLVASVSSARQFISRIDLAATPSSLTRMTDALSGDLDPSWSPDGAHVVFSSLRGGDRNIWTARPDFSGATPLTFGTDLNERPVYSPDGQEVAFISDRGGRRGIWIVSVDGKAPHLLAQMDVVGGVSWAPDGRRLVCSVPSGASPTLAIVSRESGEVRPLAVAGAATTPVWSPRADIIAYAETQARTPRTNIRFIDGTGKPVAFTLPPSLTIAAAQLAWAPDGRRLAAAAVPGVVPGSVLILDPAQAEPYRTILSLPPATLLRGLWWNPDGRALSVGLIDRTGDIVLAERRR